MVITSQRFTCKAKDCLYKWKAERKKRLDHICILVDLIYRETDNPHTDTTGTGPCLTGQLPIATPISAWLQFE